MNKHDLPTLSFKTRASLRAWLKKHHAKSTGIWLRIHKKQSGTPSVRFEDVLDEGLCFGWSESSRKKGDETSYLQRFTPRRKIGTTSQRNRDRARQLMDGGRMTPAGLAALGLSNCRQDRA